MSGPIMKLTLFATIIGVFGLVGCSEKAKTAAQPTPVVKGVVLETVRTAAIPETIEVMGTVRARTSAVVMARIPGSVSVLHVREGDRVRKGQLLAVLESAENIAQASGAAARVDEARRALDEARARQKLADVTYDRFKKLFDEQAITRQEYDQRQTERELAHQAVARLEAGLRQAQEAGKAAGTVADYTRITAPLSGVVTSKQAVLGGTVFPAQPLMTIEDEGSYQLELAAPESLTSVIRSGSPVQVTLDALQTTFNAKVAEVVPAADAASRTYVVKVNLTNKGLASGMFGRAVLSLGKSVNGIAVPKTAVFERGALHGLWVVGNDNIARMRLVKPGKLLHTTIEILAGLADGERIVVSGGEKLVDGSRVEP